MGTPLNPIADKIAALWERNKPTVRERLELLERAVTQLEQSNTPDPDLRKQAIEVAHKLAGSLGLFGHTAATESARAMEIALEGNGTPDKIRLQQHLDSLKANLYEPLQ